MATYYAIAAGGNWSAAATWSNVQAAVGRNAGAPQGPPGASDVACIDGVSGNVVVDVASAALELAMDDRGVGAFTGTLTLTAALDVGVGGANVSGTLVGAGAFNTAEQLVVLAGSVWSGTGLVTFDDALGAGLSWNTNGVSMASAPVKIEGVAGTAIALQANTVCGALEIAGGTLARGTKTLTVTGTAAAAFTLSGGTLTGSAALNIGGGIIYSSGTNSDTGAWTQTASGYLSWNAAASPIANLAIAGVGVVSTLTASTYVKKLTMGAGAFATGSAKVLVIYPAADDFIVSPVSPTVTGTGKILVSNTADRNQGAFAFGGTVDLSPSSGKNIAATGQWNLTGGALVIRSAGAAICTLSMGANGLLCGAVTLATAADKPGGLNLGTGRHSIGGIAAGASAANALAFGSARLANTGTIDGTGITCTNTAGCVAGGVVQNCNLAGQTVLLHFGAAGSGNTNVINPSRANMNRFHGRAA